MANDEVKQEVPEVEGAFSALLKKFGVGLKGGISAETVAENISRTGGEYVFETPERLAERLATWHEHISPVKRKQILEQWFAEKNIEIPEEAIKVVSVKTSDIKKREEEEEKRKREEEKRKTKFFVDTETGMIRAAKEGETALTWDEAERVADRIKKQGPKGEGEEKESAFILDSEGRWVINPKARVTGIDILAHDALSRSQTKGETRSPLEILEDDAKRLQTIQAVFGGGRGDTGLKDILDSLATVKTLFGADEDTKNLLAGIYKRLEGGEGSEQVKSLRDEVKDLRTELEKKDRERLTDQVTALRNEITGVRGELAKAVKEATAKNEYGIMSEAIKMGDKRLGAIESILVGRFGRPPALMPEGEREEVAKGIGEEAAAEEELDRLADEAFYQR